MQIISCGRSPDSLHDTFKYVEPVFIYNIVN